MHQGASHDFLLILQPNALVDTTHKRYYWPANTRNFSFLLSTMTDFKPLEYEIDDGYRCVHQIGLTIVLVHSIFFFFGRSIDSIISALKWDSVKL